MSATTAAGIHEILNAEILDAALELVGNGWAVLPCLERGSKAKAPYLTHGYNDASTDSQLIASWWTRWPSSLIGVRADSLLCLDIDPRHGGTHDALENTLGPLPDTLTCWSGRGDGGCHLYYRRPAEQIASTRLPDGVDVKQAGRGYTIAPPSRHPATGQPYRWESRPVADLPAAALRALRPKPRPIAVVRYTSPGGLTGLSRAVATAVDGKRNKITYWACRRAIDTGARSLADLAPIIAAAHTAGLTGPRRASDGRAVTEAERIALSALQGAGVSA